MFGFAAHALKASTRWRLIPLAYMFLVAAMVLLARSESASAANGAVTYTYDALGRVTSASYDTGAIVYYFYDANGNRTQQTTNLNTGALTWTATASPCTANCWGAALWHN